MSTTTLEKDTAGGWTAKSSFELGFTNMVLVFKTRKLPQQGVLVTDATVWHLDGSSMRHTFGCGADGDFNTRVATSTPMMRATRTSIGEQHQLALAAVDRIKAEALKFYKLKGNAATDEPTEKEV